MKVKLEMENRIIDSCPLRKNKVDLTLADIAAFLGEYSRHSSNRIWNKIKSQNYLRKVYSTDLVDNKAFMLPLKNAEQLYFHSYGIDGYALKTTSLGNLFTKQKNPDKAYKKGITRWRSDLTVFTDKSILRSGEIKRSKGHVNRMAIELFQVAYGKARVYLERIEKGRFAKAYYIDLNEGEIAMIPPGWYHISYALTTPCILVDIVNREGFLDWKYKKYKQNKASFTFANSNDLKGIIPNPGHTYYEHPTQLQPLKVPILKRYNDSIMQFVMEATEHELESFARAILSSKGKNHKIVDEYKDFSGNYINDMYKYPYSI